MRFIGVIAPALAVSLWLSTATAAPYRTTSGACFAVQNEFRDAISALTAQVRSDIRKAKEAGLLVGYLSTPVSPRGGGRLETNQAIASSTASAIAARFGKKIWVLNPAAYSLKVDGKDGGGGDYMAVWGDLLGGATGDGADFDFVYFLGPSDVMKYFNADEKDTLGDIEQWIAAEIVRDSSLRIYLSDDKNRANFIRFYGIRASSTFSKGSRDEWNIAVRIAARREVGSDWALYFDGHAVGVNDNVTANGGYEVSCK